MRSALDGAYVEPYTLDMGKTIATKDGSVRIDGVYTVEQSARTAAARWGLRVVMGDAANDVAHFWTCKPRDAARLERAGYEIVC